MFDILRSASNVFYGLTILGGLLAGLIVAASLGNMSSGAPDFSALIAVTFAIIPYCIARAIDGIRANDD
ncbi:hypothetical protein [Sphingopyxis sp. 550A]